ncbi:MAG: beta-glucuronidase [Kiritimatiellae bacterium]|nr:beta-glucuronidase [Kiritimatiellia bacterium]
MDIPRPEHPNPQFEREQWRNLNGAWSYTFDFGRSGTERGLAAATGFDDEILVPFCPESPLSGVGHTDFIEAMWYHRKLDIPAEWQGQTVLLHFGGVDYLSEAFVDGRLAGRHWGGTSSFCHDITPLVRAGRTHDLVVHVRDEVRSGRQPAGKQSSKFASAGCRYTRTTGIWQTVWLEAVAPLALASVHIVPDLDGARFIITPRFRAVRDGLSLAVTLTDDGRAAARVAGPAVNGLPCVVPVENPRAWSPQSPHLYGLTLAVTDGETPVDRVKSYAGLRKVHVDGNRVLLNNEPIYLRLVLDQGFYPDGIWTAPSDAALRRDIELSLAAGFNGARLHQKVFEERFHYWADTLGYLTWGESASWGADVTEPVAARNFLGEWREIVVRDRNHPSIVAWSPFNETRNVGDGLQHNRLHLDAYELTRALDPTRPVNDASGYVHVRTDLYTVHNYQQDPAKLKEILTPKPDTGVYRNHPDHDAAYGGQPYILDEFGGIKWIAEGHKHADTSWGYGEGPTSLDAFYQRLEGQVRAIRELEHIAGFCYTQLTDVEQEQNGLYNFDRTEKFDTGRIAAIFRA